MGRISFSASIASGSLAGVKLDPAAFEGKDTAGITRGILGRDPTPETEAALEQGTAGKDLTAPFHRIVSAWFARFPEEVTGHVDETHFLCAAPRW